MGINKRESLQGWINLIDDMLLDEDYEFATNTLEGILKDIKRKNRITDKQEKAVNNIYNSINSYK